MAKTIGMRNSGNSDGFSLQAAIGAALLILVALVVITLMTSMHIVPPGHRGVRVTLGSVSPEALPEGVAWAAPFFLGDIKLVNVQQQTNKEEAACFSRDLQTIKAQCAIMYRVPADRVVRLYQEYQGDPYASLVSPRLQESIKQVTASYNAEEVVQKREQIRELTLARLKSVLGDLVEIQDVNIMNIDLSSQLEQAIEAKMVSQQEALAKSFELEREKTQAEITVIQARAEAESVKIKGEALSLAPKVIELEIVKRWDGRAPQTLVVGSGEGASIILPVGAQPARREASAAK